MALSSDSGYELMPLGSGRQKKEICDGKPAGSLPTAQIVPKGLLGTHGRSIAYGTPSVYV